MFELKLLKKVKKVNNSHFSYYQMLIYFAYPNAAIALTIFASS